MLLSVKNFFFVLVITCATSGSINFAQPLFLLCFALLCCASLRCNASSEITSQFSIIDPLNRKAVKIFTDQIIENDFLRFDFSGYSLRNDQIIDFGKDPEMESLTFTTYQGADWMDAVRSHYFEIFYWKESRNFEEIINGPSWFSTSHHDREGAHEEYFFTQSGFPAYLIISWERYNFKVDGFRNYYYSLLIDATTSSHLSNFQNISTEARQPWLEIRMQSMVGEGSNLSIEEKLSEITIMLHQVMDNISIIEKGTPSPRINITTFEEASSNSSPFSFIQADDLGQGWNSSDWFGVFYKSIPGHVYHQHLGWLQYANYTTQSSWCWHPALSWFWISQTTYPHIYLSSGAWSYLEDIGGGVFAYDYTSSEWRSLNDLTPNEEDSFKERISKIQNSFKSKELKQKEISRYLLEGK